MLLESDKRRFQAEAEKRRAMAIATEQENIAKVAENRAAVVLAEADVPKAMRQKLKKPKAPLWKKVAEHHESIDWDAISVAAAKPSGIAFSVGPGSSGDITTTVAAAPKVRNAIPVGATWNGVEDQYAGDPQFAKPAEGEGMKASSGN